MKTVKTLIAIVATMAGTEFLMFWLGAAGRPVSFIAAMALYAVGLWFFGDSKEKSTNTK